MNFKKLAMVVLNGPQKNNGKFLENVIQLSGSSLANLSRFKYVHGIAAERVTVLLLISARTLCEFVNAIKKI